MSEKETVRQQPQLRLGKVAIPPVITLTQGDKEEPLIDTSKFTKEQLEQAKNVAEALNWTDSNEIAFFGADPQKGMSSFLDTLLNGVKVKDAGPAGQMVVAIALGIKKSGLKDFQEAAKRAVEGGMVQKFIDKLVKEAKFFFKQYQELDTQMRQIEALAMKRQDNLIGENTKLDQLKIKNGEFQDEMALWIVAGDIAKQIGLKKLAELQQKSQASNDPKDSMEAASFKDQVTRFDVRLTDMKTAYLRSIPNDKVIDVAQEAIRIEIDNIIRAILNDLPALKQAVVNAKSIYEVILAQSDREARAAAVEQIEKANAEALQQAIITAKKSQGEDLLTKIKHVDGLVNSLLQTMEKTAELDKVNEQKRVEGVKLIEATQKKFVEGLKKINASL